MPHDDLGVIIAAALGVALVALMVYLQLRGDGS